MCLAAAPYTFVLVRAFLSPTNFATASSAHLLPCPSPPSHIVRPHQLRLLHDAKLAGEFCTGTRIRSAPRGTSQIRRQDVMGRGGGILRQTSQAVPPLLSTWSCVWGTNVLLSAMPVMIHAISVALVHWSPTSSRRNTLEVPQQGARPEK